MKKVAKQKTNKSSANSSGRTLTAKLALGLMISMFLLATYSVFGTSSAATPEELKNTSVKIVRPDGRSGGSGVILSSSKTESRILTNSHVCGVVEKGGNVIRGEESHAVTSYRHSKNHDLCMITVSGDFGVDTPLAKSAPILGTESIVVGHPRLMPTLLTRGSFSDHEMVEVMTKVRACTEKDITDDLDNAILCFFLGGIPVVQRYEAQVISSLIQPGSSGSPVFNDKGEISGLVFAGSGAIGFGLIVPYEYVYNFVTNESYSLEKIIPNTSYEINGAFLRGNQGTQIRRAMPLDSFEFNSRLDEMCSDKSAKSKLNVQNICNIHSKNAVWRK
jgi:hypothetical protein